MYQSPFRIIDADALPQDPQALRRALLLEKKKLMAEFELAGSATIVTGNRELHRQEIISLFDELGNEALLSYHNAIRQDKVLRHFLEEGEIQPGKSWESNAMYNDTGFLSFISPYFAAACNAFMQRALAGAASVEARQALHQAGAMLLPADTEAAYRYVTRFFTEKKNELLAISNRAENGAAVGIAEITAWCTDDQIHLLNRLPDTFTTLRYTLANTLNNLCVTYDRSKANRLALAAIERAATIRTEDEELQELIPANLRIIRGKQSRSWYNVDPQTGRKTPKIGLIIVLIVIIIHIATAGNGCNQNARVDIRNLPTVSYKAPTPTAHEQSFKSLLKALVRPEPVSRWDTFRSSHQYAPIRPEAAGDNSFRNIFHDSLNEKLAAGYGFSETGRVYLNNQSDWEAIFIYQLGDREFGSAYVPPHESYTLSYTTHNIAVQLYAGRDWSDGVRHAYNHYTSPHLPTRRVFSGGFSVRAAIPFDDTTGVPMFARRTDPDHNVADTLSLFNAPGNVIHVTYNLDED